MTTEQSALPDEKCATCGRLRDEIWNAEDGRYNTWARHDCGFAGHEGIGCHPFLPALQPLSSRAVRDERICDRCGGPNPLSWHAPSPLWNAVMRKDGVDEVGFCCPSCFIAVAQERGVNGNWHLGIDETDHAGVLSVDGRVWDASKCLWVTQPLSSTEDAREVLFTRMTFAEHYDSCPANHQRVRNQGPCACGLEAEVNAELDVFARAIRAEAEAPQDGFVIDGVLSHDASDEWTPEAEESARDAILDFIESRGWQFGGAMGVAR